MHVRLQKLLHRQDGAVARWQLLGLGMTDEAIRHFAAGVRRPARGVYLTGHGRPTRRQRRWIAVLHRPASYLAGSSAGALWEFRPWERGFEVVTRVGSGGPRRHGQVVVHHTDGLAGDVTTFRGLPVTTPERTILDLAGTLGPKATRKAVREAVRLKRTTMDALGRRLVTAAGRRGVADLRGYVARHTTLPFDRCRSDAEAMGLVVLADADCPIPAVNVDVAGEEADFSWSDRRLIIEVDGPDFHRFPEEDVRKDAVWRAAGWTVRRLPSGLVFDEPERLVVLHRRPT